MRADNALTLHPVFSEPLRELGGERPDQVSELHLGGKKIQRLRGFEKFVNLRDLYLENNMIQQITNLESCRRLTMLSLHDNMISSITGVFKNHPCLEVLLLHKNQLRGLEEVVRELQFLKYLHTLTLFGNILEEESNYRAYTVYHLRHLRVFDRRSVSTRLRTSIRQFFAVKTGAKNLSASLHRGTALALRQQRRSATPESSSHRKRDLRAELATEAQDIIRARADREAQELAALFEHGEAQANAAPKLPPLPRSLDFLASRRVAPPPPPPPSPPSALTPFVYTQHRWVPEPVAGADSGPVPKSALRKRKYRLEKETVSRRPDGKAARAGSRMTRNPSIAHQLPSSSSDE